MPNTSTRVPQLSFTLLTTLFTCTLILFFAQSALCGSSENIKELKRGFRVTLGVLPLNISGLQDVHVSDWELWGTGSTEGRAEIKLSESNSKAGLGFGATVGIDVKIFERLFFVFDLPFIYNEQALGACVNIGFLLNVVKAGRFTLGVFPKGGYAFCRMSPSEVEMLPGKMPPIVTTNYTLNEGDPISGTSHGASVTTSLVPAVNITPKFKLMLDAGWRFAFMGKPTLEIGNDDDVKTLNFNDPEVIQPENDEDGNPVQAKATGKVSMSGLVIQFGFRYGF